MPPESPITGRRRPPKSRTGGTESGNTIAAAKKARELFRFAQKVNPELTWHECLAQKATERARLIEQGGKQAFQHRDPRTKRNPAWKMIQECGEFADAGENLARDDAGLPASDIHDGLMRSPTHRKNIENKKYRFLGVGCWGETCVQFFAGGHQKRGRIPAGR